MSRLKSGRASIRLLVIGLLLLLIAAFVLQDSSFRVSWKDRTRRKPLLYDGEVLALFEGYKLEQTFVANYPGLSKIEVLFSGKKRGSEAAAGLVSAEEKLRG